MYLVAWEHSVVRIISQALQPQGLHGFSLNTTAT